MIRSLSDLFFLIGVICLVFVTIVTAPYLGIKQVTTVSSIIIFLFSVNFLFKNWQIISQKNNQSIVFYIFVSFLISAKVSVISGDIFNGIYFLKDWLNPILILIYFENIKSKKRNILKKVLLFFFIVECLLGIYERLTTTLVFGSLESVGLTEFYDGKIENLNVIFRSQSLLGNPLNNAHLICVMLGVILNSSINLKNTFVLLLLGIISILCFNARAATISVFLVALIYFLMVKNKLNNRQFNLLLLLFTVGFTIILYLLFNSSLGGRLIYGDKLLDGSAKARFDAFDIFLKFYNTKNLLIGDPTIEKINLTENGYLNMMIFFGIPFAFLLILSQVFLIFSRIRNFNIHGKSIILICFFLVGFSNNNLAQADSLLLLCVWLSAFSKNVLYKTRLQSN